MRLTGRGPRGHMSDERSQNSKKYGDCQKHTMPRCIYVIHDNEICWMRVLR
jgi:hypothetical protein